MRSTQRTVEFDEEQRPLALPLLVVIEAREDEVRALWCGDQPSRHHLFSIIDDFAEQWRTGQHDVG